jgi:membrane-bound serine protease (ClpP class)
MDPKGTPTPGPADAGAAGPKRDSDFIPAAPMSPRVAAEINEELDNKGAKKSVRPNLRDPEHTGKYKPVEYVCDGSGVVTLRESELLRFGVAERTVRNDDELKAFFGAKYLVRLDENWADISARFLSNFIVRMVLMVVFLVALFVEMSHPGLSLPGAIAAICLLGIILPPILAGIAGWWALLAIMAGIGLICVEVFITPGLAIFGVVGVLLLFCGLVGTFLVGPAAGSMFPGVGRSGGQIGWAVASVFITLFFSGAAIVTLLRFIPHLPVFNRLVLTTVTPEGDNAAATPYAQPFAGDSVIQPGMTGEAVTPLRPAGRVQIGDKVVDAIADGAFIEAGGQVRVLTAGPFRVTVEAV